MRTSSRASPGAGELCGAGGPGGGLEGAGPERPRRPGRTASPLPSLSREALLSLDSTLSAPCEAVSTAQDVAGVRVSGVGAAAPLHRRRPREGRRGDPLPSRCVQTAAAEPWRLLTVRSGDLKTPKRPKLTLVFQFRV